MLLDVFLPVFHFHEVHSTVVNAPPEQIWRAFKEIMPAEIRVMRPFFWIRGLPSMIRGRRYVPLSPQRPLLDQLLSTGFVMLAENSDEMVLGTIGRFWEWAPRSLLQLSDAQAFMAFDAAGYAKAAINFSLDPLTVRDSWTLRTETRVYVPDRESRRRFSIYWRIIHPGSGLIRRSLLRAIKRRAEK